MVTYVFVFILIINVGFSPVFAVNNETQTQIQTSHPGSHRCQFNAPGGGCPSVDKCDSNCRSCLRGFPHITSICVLSSNTCVCSGWKGELMEAEIKDLMAAAINNGGKFDNGFREIACEQILKTDEMVQLTEAGVCKAKSHHFNGGCLSSHKCALVCMDEGFSGGRCPGFGCRCFCPKLC